MALRARELYARALFEACLEGGTLEETGRELSGLRELLAANPAYGKLMSSPSLAKEKRRELLNEAFGELHPMTLNFLKVLADNGRFGELDGIAGEFQALLDEHNGVLAVTAVTAMPLSRQMEEKLLAKLSAETGKEIRLTNQVDASLLGGILLRYDGKEIDGTVRARLSGIREKILSAGI